MEAPPLQSIYHTEATTRFLFTTYSILLLAAAEEEEEEKERGAHLTRQALLHPRTDITAWNALYNGDGESFTSAVRLSRHAFNTLLHDFSIKFIEFSLYTGGVPKNSHIAHRLLRPEDALGMCLYYLCHPVDLHAISIIFGLPQATTTRYLWSSLKVLNSILPLMAIPPIEDLEMYAEAIKRKYDLLDTIIGFVDGLRLTVEMAQEFNKQKLFYNGWTKTHNTVNVMYVNFLFTINYLLIIHNFLLFSIFSFVKVFKKIIICKIQYVSSILF
jgi:hypothetical protein